MIISPVNKPLFFLSFIIYILLVSGCSGVDPNKNLPEPSKKKGNLVMPNKTIIATEYAPRALGTYSQAIQVGTTVYLSGQIGIDPKTNNLVGKKFTDQAEQVFENLKTICESAGGKLEDIVKLNVYLTDIKNFTKVSEVMSDFFSHPYPARAVVEVNALPMYALIEIDAVMEL